MLPSRLTSRIPTGLGRKVTGGATGTVPGCTRSQNAASALIQLELIEPVGGDLEHLIFVVGHLWTSIVNQKWEFLYAQLGDPYYV